MPQTPWLQPVTLEGRIVRLEPLERRHLDDLAAAGADPAVWRWLPDTLTTPERLAPWLESALANRAAGTELPFVTVDRASGRVVGTTRFMAIAPEHRRVEIGWTWLGTAAQGTGANAEAKLLQLEHAFDVVGCRRVEFKTDALNERSRAALAKIGASFDGVFRQHMLMADGRSRDSAWYAIIDAEWPPVRDRLRAIVDEAVRRRG